VTFSQFDLQEKKFTLFPIKKQQLSKTKRSRGMDPVFPAKGSSGLESWAG